jgi:SAM-dependent methyltransferase
VGCGTGASVHYLRSKYRVGAVGLDPSASLLKEWREKRGREIPLARATASSMPIGDEKLDGILCECVLSLTADPLAVLREFHRALLPQGFLILTDLYLRAPERSAGLLALPINSCLSGAVAKSETEARVAESGFRTLLWEDHSALLRDLVVQLIFAHGPLQGLWSWNCTNQDASALQSAVRLSKPGYYLLIAEKGERPRTTSHSE